MFTSTKNIIITTLCLALALFAFTKALSVSEADTDILTITHEIQNNSAKYTEANSKITAAQAIIDAEKPKRDQAEADNIRLRAALLDLTKVQGSAANTGDQPVDAGTSGKRQPTE